MTYMKKSLLCLALIWGAFLLPGCVSQPSSTALAVSRAHPFVVALAAYHLRTGDYPRRLDDLYPHYLGTNILWYHNTDPKNIWALSYEKIGKGDYKLYLYSAPCSQAVFEDGAFVAGYGPYYEDADWRVFYNSGKSSLDFFSIPNAPRPLEFYADNIPDWNEDLLIPRAKINSAETVELGRVGRKRVVEIRQSLEDVYYSDARTILEETMPNQFLPVYVQVYNKVVSWPSDEIIRTSKLALIVDSGLEYSGTGRFHRHFEITFSRGRKPVVIEIYR